MLYIHHFLSPVNKRRGPGQPSTRTATRRSAYRAVLDAHRIARLRNQAAGVVLAGPVRVLDAIDIPSVLGVLTQEGHRWRVGRAPETQKPKPFLTRDWMRLLLAPQAGGHESSGLP